MARAAYHHGDLREALLRAAEEQLAERGPEGFTLRETARRVGVSNAAPAHHFPDVGALLTELAAIGFERLTAAMRAAATEAATPEERLRAIGRAYVERAIAAPALFRLMFHSDRCDRTSPRLAAAGDEAYGVLDAVVAALPGCAAPESRYPDVAFAWSAVHGFAVLCIEGRLAATDPRFSGPGAWRTQLEALTARVLRGVLDHAGEPRC
jgi:AcrR family transcriptional regulator